MTNGKWWKFWHPESGTVGGVIFGLIIGLLLTMVLPPVFLFLDWWWGLFHIYF